LALGNLLRKRGEVGRAIKVHQNLLARPGLPLSSVQLVQLELARDYIKLGLLDRAETLMQELSEITEGSLKTICLESLIDIYRDEKDWLKGIACINRLVGRFSRLPERWLEVKSHFYCELAEECLQKNDDLGARRYLKSAFSAHKASARVSLLQADLEMRQGNYMDAIDQLKQVPLQDTSRIPEMLPMLVASYTAVKRKDRLKSYLLNLSDGLQSASVIQAAATVISQEESDQAALSFVGKYVSDRPTLKGVGEYLSMQLAGEDDLKRGVQTAEQAIFKLSKNQHTHLCQQCGFSGRQMHWLCPGCKGWGTVRAVE